MLDVSDVFQHLLELGVADSSVFVFGNFLEDLLLLPAQRVEGLLQFLQELLCTATFCVALFVESV